MKTYYGQHDPWQPNVLAFNPLLEAKLLGVAGRAAYGMAIKWPTAARVVNDALQKARRC